MQALLVVCEWQPHKNVWTAVAAQEAWCAYRHHAWFLTLCMIVVPGLTMKAQALLATVSTV